jgi:hypothetical protein
MKLNKKDFLFSEWQRLSYSEKREIWNHYWNPYKPLIGYDTKKDIVRNFIEISNIDGLQFGLRCFGWEVYEIYVVVENSKIRVPKKFADLPVNKGLLINKINDSFATVKFDYGGTLDIDLTEKIFIG